MPNKKKSEPIQRFSISDELWERLEPLLPRPRRKSLDIALGGGWSSERTPG